MENARKSFFNGSFDAESRERFRTKREKHGLSRYALAKLLGVDEVTVRRWECGPTVKVTQVAREIIEAFLSGSVDRRLDGTAVVEQRIRIPRALLKRIENLASIYALCGDSPEIQGELIAGLEAIAKGAQ